MQKLSFKSQIITNVVWRFGERISAQLVTFIVSIVLARLLTPSEFGVVALLMIFIDIANVFVSNGLGIALVQKKDADDLDFCSAFYAGIVVNSLFYLLLFATSPLLENWFSQDGFSAYMRVLALKIPLSAISSVQHAFVQRKMIFRKFFFATLIGTIISAIVGVFLAFHHFGAWAIISQYLTNSLCDTVILWLIIEWKPRLMFSLSRVCELFQFGWKVLASGLVSVLYGRLTSLLIGKEYSTSDLAFYEQGGKIPGLFQSNISWTILSVLFPAMSKVQDSPDKVKNILRKSNQIVSFFVWPLMLGMAALSAELVNLVYSEKWLPCVIFMQIACIKLSVLTAQTASEQACQAVGRSDISLRNETASRVIGVCIILITIQFGLIPLAIGGIAQTVTGVVMYFKPNKQFFSYEYAEQITDLLRPSIPAVIMAGIVYISDAFLNISSNLIILLIQFVIGITAYTLLSIVLQKETLLEVLTLFHH